MLKKIINTYRTLGIKGVVDASYHQVVPRRARCLNMALGIVSNSKGLEVGGPSDVFRPEGELPLYPEILNLDNCNFSQNTTWEGEVHGGLTFAYDSGRSLGHQYILDASALHALPSAGYDFVLSCHCLEHLANPLQGLSEWLRVLKDDGFLILLLPHKERTFDHRRPITSLQHLIDDFDKGVGEDDLTHLEEILELHDLDIDVEAGTPAEFEQRSRDNYNNRCIHQHVFDNQLVQEMLTYMQLQIHALENVLPFHIIAIAQKLPVGSAPDNRRFSYSGAPSWV